MRAEFDLGGLLIPAVLAWGTAALAVSLPLRWALERAGAYRWIWHRGLFDIALFFVLWGGICVLASR